MQIYPYNNYQLIKIQGFMYSNFVRNQVLAEYMYSKIEHLTMQLACQLNFEELEEQLKPM